MNILILPIQVFLSIVLLFAISRVYLRLKDKVLSIGEFLFWISVFSFALVGVIEPQFTTYIAQMVGIGRGTDVVIYISIVLLFYLVFRTNVLIENTRHDITKLVRKISLSNLDKKSSRDKKSSKK